MARWLGAVVLMLSAVATFAAGAEQSAGLAVSATVVPVLRAQGASFQTGPTAGTGESVSSLGVSGTWTYMRRDLVPAPKAGTTRPSANETPAPGNAFGEQIQLTLARL